MSNLMANALDWYVNALNKAHVIPVNGATLARDVIAKQLGDKNFVPRTLTIDNFTDAELDALYRLSQVYKGSDEHGLIDMDSYEALKRKDLEPPTFFVSYYGDESKDLSEYLTPLRMVGTTIGRAAVKKDGDDYVLEDTYDFNPDRVTTYIASDGKKRYNVPGVGTYDNEESAKKAMREESKKRRSVYSRLRSNAYRLGHNSSDPENVKIKTKLSMKEIKERLGNKLGQMDITSPVPKNTFVRNGIAAGALTGAPIGATLGAIAGLMFLFDKKNRKKWLIRMLIHTLGGAALGSALGAAGGGYVSNKVYSAFGKTNNYSRKGDSPDDQTKSASDNGVGKGVVMVDAKKARKIRKMESAEKREKRLKALTALAWSLAYSVPAVLLAGGGAYAGYRARPIIDGLLKETDDSLTVEWDKL